MKSVHNVSYFSADSPEVPSTSTSKYILSPPFFGPGSVSTRKPTGSQHLRLSNGAVSSQSTSPDSSNHRAPNHLRHMTHSGGDSDDCVESFVLVFLTYDQFAYAYCHNWCNITCLIVVLNLIVGPIHKLPLGRTRASQCSRNTTFVAAGHEVDTWTITGLIIKASERA